MYGLLRVNGVDFPKIKDDPVRPHLSFAFRTGCDREIYYLHDEKQLKVGAVICVAYTNEVPTSEYELDLFSQAACQDDQHGSIAVFYTVWSYDKGCGRDIIFRLAGNLKNYKGIKRFVTLSPKTEMAEKFHLGNGAIVLQRNETTDNYEYLNV